MATKWGIVSVGKMSSDFATALKSLPREEHALVAVAARDEERAKAFAVEHGIQKSYGSYEAMAKDPDFEVTYVANLNPDHYAVSKMLLEHGKSVICETPLCMNHKQVKSLLEIAASKKLFVLEAVWCRFFPLYDFIREQLKAGTIGDVVQVEATFGVPIAEEERIRQKELGGGSILDIGLFVLQFADMVLGDKAPISVKATGHLNEEGVDLNMATVLTYSGNRTAVLSCSTLCEMSNDAYVYGTKGYIKIPEPFWCPTRVIVNGEETEFPLPETNFQFKYTNTAGLMFEAAEVRRCLKAGLTESPFMTHQNSIQRVVLQDEIRRQIGVVFPQDE